MVTKNIVCARFISTTNKNIFTARTLQGNINLGHSNKSIWETPTFQDERNITYAIFSSITNTRE